MLTRTVVFALAALLAAAAPVRAETNKVRLAVQFGLIYLPVVLAQEEGFFVSEAKALGLPGLEVTMSRFSGSTAITDAVLSGNVDLAAFGTPGLLIAWEKTRGRQRIVGLAAMGAHRHRLFTGKPQLKTLKDFTDQDKISAPGNNSPQAILLRIASGEILGSTQKADQFLVNMPHPEALAAVQAGTISGYISSPPFSQILERNPQIHAIFSSTEIFGGRDASVVIFGGFLGFMEDNPKVALAVLNGIDAANRLIKENPKRAAEIYLKTEKVKLSEQEVVGILTDGSITYDAAPHGLVRYATYLQKLGMLKTVPGAWQDVFAPLLKDRPGD